MTDRRINPRLAARRFMKLPARHAGLVCTWSGEHYAPDKLPPLHYSMCGCESISGYPERWGGK